MLRGLNPPLLTDFRNYFFSILPEQHQFVLVRCIQERRSQPDYGNGSGKVHVVTAVVVRSDGEFVLKWCGAAGSDRSSFAIHEGEENLPEHGCRRVFVRSYKQPITVNLPQRYMNYFCLGGFIVCPESCCQLL